MVISVQRKSLLNLNISPFAFSKELLLEELVESRTRDNTLRFNNLQFTNHKKITYTTRLLFDSFGRLELPPNCFYGCAGY